MEILVKLDEGAFIPEKAHEADAGYDLRCMEDVYVLKRGCATIDTGVHMAIPKGYVGFIKSKSGLNVKHCLRAEGVIDSGYTGSIVVKMYNDSDVPYFFNKGEKLTQIVILPVPETELVVSSVLDVTERGNGGFGSTGR